MMNDSNISAQLRDIKPLLEIPDNSFYFYWALIAFVLTLCVLILFFVFKKVWENRKTNLEKEYLLALKAIDWSETKEAAYEATYYARLLASDARRKELFSQLEPMLMQYKYKKVVDDIDEKTRKQFNLYVQVANESV